MGLSREILLWASRNEWLKEHVPRWRFVRYSVRRFMPGEDVSAAFAEAERFQQQGIFTVFTRLGENIEDLSEAKAVTRHYLEVLAEIKRRNLPTEISVKLTQLGFDLSEETTLANFRRLAEVAEREKNWVWIDMEDSSYVDRTLAFYETVRQEFRRVGLCLQSYLYRSYDDLERLLQKPAAIRLVKGAYKEPKHIAFPKKRDVDANYFRMAERLLQDFGKNTVRAAIATHDVGLIERIRVRAHELGIADKDFEVQMLYGIRPVEQLRLVREGVRMGVLISYGESWYPWYMRRLAERPANVLFVLKNLFVK